VGDSGFGGSTYQWQFDGNVIPGATDSSLLLTNLQFTNAGIYSVVVSNAAGTLASSPAFLNVVPVLGIQPTTNGIILTWSGPFTLQSALDVTGPYTDVPGATSPYYVNTTDHPQMFFRLRSGDLNLTIDRSGVASVLSAQRTNNGIILTWSGPSVLQSALSVAGPYNDVPGATSPYYQSTTQNPQMFFRLRTVNANPTTLINVSGPPGVTFILQGSDDLVNWFNILTNTAPCTWSDPAAAQHPSRMYRLRLAPITPNLQPSYSPPVLQIRAALDWFDDALLLAVTERPAVMPVYRSERRYAPAASLAKLWALT
jgi:hypothetical protein